MNKKTNYQALGKMSVKKSNLKCLSILLYLLFLTGCSFFKSDEQKAQGGVASSVATAAADKTLVSKSSSTIKAKDPVIENWALQLAQADAVFREAWRLAANQELSLGKSPFGRLYRVVVKDLGVKMAGAMGLQCDRYRIEKTGSIKLPIWELYNDCGSSEQRWLGQVQQTSSGMTVSFSPEAMQDVLGIQSSILARKIQCQFRLQGSNFLAMNCEKFSKDKNADEVLRFDRFEYSKTSDPMIFVTGKVLVQLSEKKKFEFKLPQSGRGLLVETELFPPPKEEVPPVAPQALPPTPSPVPNASSKNLGPAQSGDLVRRQLPVGAAGGRRLPEGSGQEREGVQSEPGLEIQELSGEEAHENSSEENGENQNSVDVEQQGESEGGQQGNQQDEQESHSEINQEPGSGSESGSVDGIQGAPVQDPRNSR